MSQDQIADLGLALWIAFATLFGLVGYLIHTIGKLHGKFDYQTTRFNIFSAQIETMFYTYFGSSGHDEMLSHDDLDETPRN